MGKLGFGLRVRVVREVRFYVEGGAHLVQFLGVMGQYGSFHWQRGRRGEELTFPSRFAENMMITCGLLGKA
jgi:hypothetical protein